MRVNHYSLDKLSNLFGIQIGSIEGLNAPAGWGRVAPGERSTSHRHDETEFFVIVQGQGSIQVGGQSHEVGSGSVAVFEPFETHVIANTGSEDLVFFLSYRRDAERASQSATSPERQVPAQRPQFVFSTPPTPNGDLHLGHLSGPYLGADAYVRYQRLIGHTAWHLTGSDDYQSYVDALARKDGKRPAQVAEYYSAEILQTLAAMDIELDQYTVTDKSPDYASGLQRYFTRLVDSGRVACAQVAALQDPETGAYLYEVDVCGACPGCGRTTNGNICEECGEPNVVVDLGEPLSRLSDQPAQRVEREQFTLPLGEFTSDLERHHSLGRVPARLKELTTRVLAHERLDIPMTHYSDWGIRPVESDQEQVIWVWPEMSYGFLYGIEALGRRLGADWNAQAPQRDWKIVHFFGYDNSFYHGILYPVLYRLAWPDWQPDIDYHVNEFYLLDGKKFSTSRRHAVWGKDILTPETVDAVRYYLCLTRPEDQRSNFELAAYRETVRDVLVGKWQAWLGAVGDRVNRHHAGVVPDAGIWTAEHSAFLATLAVHLEAVTRALNPEGFSLRRAAAQLNRLVDDAMAFAATQQLLASAAHLKDEYRTSVALELAAAQLLAQLAAPLMPRFSTRLLQALGSTSGAVWPRTVEIMVPGSQCSLADATFFQNPNEPGATEHGADQHRSDELPVAQPCASWLQRQVELLIPTAGTDAGSRTLQELGASSLVAVTLQYQLLQDKALDVPIDKLMHTPLDVLAREVDACAVAKDVTEEVAS